MEIDELERRLREAEKLRVEERERNRKEEERNRRLRIDEEERNRKLRIDEEERFRIEEQNLVAELKRLTNEYENNRS